MPPLTVSGPGEAVEQDGREPFLGAETYSEPTRGRIGAGLAHAVGLVAVGAIAVVEFLAQIQRDR